MSDAKPTPNLTLVTGGNGFIGSVVVRALCSRGVPVRLLLREHSRTDRLADLPFERSLGDVRDGDSVLRAMRGCSQVIHLASLSSWSDIHSPHMPDVVVGGTRHVLTAASALGKPRIVYVSSSTAIDGTATPVVLNEDSPLTLPLDDFIYVKAKRAAEDLCREAVATEGLPVTIVNPTEVYGPNDVDGITSGTLIDFAKSTPVVVSHGGTSIVHVEDVALGILAALEKGRPGERYILGGDNLTIEALARLTLDILGRRAPVVTIPSPLIRALGWLGTHLHVPVPFNPAVAPYAVRYWFMDNTKARTELGVDFRPAREVLAPTLAWLSAHRLA